MTSAPKATPQPASAATPKRPVWVWVITILYTFSFGFTLLSLWIVLSGALPMTPANEEYFAGLGPLDYITSLGLGLLTLTGAALLFLMRKAAVLLFVASLALNLGLTLVHALTKNWAQAMGGSGLVGASVGWVILGAVTSYSWRLRQAGKLR